MAYSTNFMTAAILAFTPGSVLADSGSTNNVMTPRPLAAVAPVRRQAVGEYGHANVVELEDATTARVRELSVLQAGWAGAGSVAINRDALARASAAVERVKLLVPSQRLPQIVPCADGSVQIELHGTDGCFEMYFEVDGSISAWWHELASDAEFVAEGREADLLLERWAIRPAAWKPVAFAA